MTLRTFGTEEQGRDVFRRMYAGSSAYRALINDTVRRLGRKSVHDLSWGEIPILTKESFYAAHPWREILPRKSYRDIYSVLRSSGTSTPDGSSKGFFWPQLKSVEREAAPYVHGAMRDMFHLDERSTLAIVALSLGSWAGGEQFAFAFKSLALTSSLPLVVFSPGNQHAEIVELIEKCGSEFEQILIALCPSAIFYLERLAEKAGAPLPLEKISFIATGEPFPEDLRRDVHGRSGRKATDISVLSVYGAADTGMIGVESPALIQVRQFLNTSPEAAAAAGFAPGSIPNLYHARATRGLLEMIDGELVVTQWQGLPLVRYNLEDRVTFHSWQDLCSAIAGADPARVAVWNGLAQLPMPDVISVKGRSGGCVFLCGSNIFETMLQEVFMRSPFAGISSGDYVVWTEIRKGQQVLCWQIEMKPGAAVPEQGEREAAHAEMVALLSRAQPEFAEDYEQFYKPFEADGLRIFHFEFTPPGSLSANERHTSAIKKRIIVERGPIS